MRATRTCYCTAVESPPSHGVVHPGKPGIEAGRKQGFLITGVAGLDAGKVRDQGTQMRLGAGIHNGSFQ
jgi:hypothetical protein